MVLQRLLLKSFGSCVVDKQSQENRLREIIVVNSDKAEAKYLLY